MTAYIYANGAVYPMTRAGLQSFAELINGLDEEEIMKVRRCSKKDCTHCDNYLWYGGKKQCDYFIDVSVPGHAGYCFGYRDRRI